MSEDDYLDILTEEQQKENQLERDKNKIEYPVIDKKIKILKEQDKKLADTLERKRQWQLKQKQLRAIKEEVYQKNLKLYPNSLPVLCESVKRMILGWFGKY